MKKILKFVFIALASTVLCSGCSFLNPGTSSQPETRRVTDLQIVDSTQYKQGMVFKTANNLKVSAVYNTEPRIVELTSSDYGIVSITDPDHLSATTTLPLDKLGFYTAKIKHSTITKEYTFEVKEATDETDSINSIQVLDSSPNYKVEDIYSLNNNLKVKVNWKYRGIREISYNSDGIHGYKFLNYGPNKCVDPNGNDFDPTKEFTQPGVHKLAVEYKGVSSPSFNVNVTMNAIALDRITAYSIEPNGNPIIDVGDVPSVVLKDKYKVTVTYKKLSNPSESLVYVEDLAFDSPLYTVLINKKGETTNISNTAITTEKELEVSVFNPSYTSIKSNKLDLNVDSLIKRENNKYNYYRVNNQDNVNPYGNQKVLVIPTYFQTDSANATQTNWNRIQKGFFGTNDECGWKSFTGYYHDMSYGQLNYSGYISPEWYHSTEYTIAQMRASEDPSRYIAAHALAWFKEQNPTFDFTDYDTNNDGYVDSLYIIYASDYIRTADSGCFWGYRWSTNVVSGTGIQASAFSWFSMKFLNDVNDYGGVPTGGINTRIITHEHGHMLGLPDYYDYGYSGVDYVGSWDMQSNNRLDWNAYSKYATGFVKPYYPVLNKFTNGQEVEITMGDLGTTGDCLIIPTTKWNGSAFGEYIMIELFNPNAINNKYDANKLGLGYGIKIYHVNSTLFEYVTGTGFVIGGELHSDSKVQLRDHMYSNDYDDYNPYGNYHTLYDYYKETNVTRNYKILRMLQKGNVSTFDKTSGRNEWNDSDLWKTGDTFTIGSKSGYTNYGTNFLYNKTTMDDGTSFKFGITFNSVSATSVTLTLKYFA